MTTLVTGATGLIGHGIASRLVERGERVRALVRDPGRARAVLPEGVELASGDVTDRDSVRRALEGVRLVYHSAGLPEQWLRDERQFDTVNCGGTRNVLSAAREAGVARAVYTSTMDVFAAPPGGTLREDRPDPDPKPTAYERSKLAAERAADEVLAAGLPVVHINPAAVYGPGPTQTALNGLLLRIARGQVPAIPPNGVAIAFVDGVVEAHLAAAERGQPGGRYLVADAYLSYRRLAQLVLGRDQVPPVAPLWLLTLVAAITAPLGRWLGFHPPVSPGEVAFLRWDVRVDATKAVRELGFKATSPEEGVARTLANLTAPPTFPRRASPSP